MSKAKHRSSNEAGFALVAAMVIVLVLSISAVGIFTMASYETKNSEYRSSSIQALYLADAGIERAKAKLKDDSSWRDGWSNVPLGNGYYSIALQDTSFTGVSNVIRVTSAGWVENANRKIEVLAETPGGGFDYALLVKGDATAKGNLCINGEAHICGTADFGNHDVHLHCGTYTDGYDIDPKMVFTEPSFYPDATYYYVRGDFSGGKHRAVIQDRNGVDITGALGDDLVGVTSYSNSTGRFTFSFGSTSEIEYYFNDSTGIFRRTTGDQAVIVNFGEAPVLDPPGLAGLSNVIFKGNNSEPFIHASIFNTRFIGVSNDDRLDTTYWRGGDVETKKVVFEPYHGISMIIHDFQQQAGALSQIGTSNWPGLVYVTGEVVKVRANFYLEGAIVVLDNWNNTGGPDLVFNTDFEAYLPGYFQDPIYGGSTGDTHVLRWREMATSY